MKKGLIFVFGIALIIIFNGEVLAQNWIHTGPGAAAGGITEFALDPNNPENVFLTINCGGLRKSIDSGNTWKVKNNGLVYEKDGLKGHKINGFNIHPVYGTYFVGTKTWRIYTSDDAGDNWELSFDVYDSYSIPGDKDFFGTFAFDSNNPDVVYAGVWNMDNFESDELMRPKTQGLILKGTRTFNGEKYIWTWTEFANSNSFPNIPNNQKIGFPAIVVHPYNSNIIFVSTTFGLYKTIDGGLNWLKVDLETGTGIELYATGNFVIDPVDPDTMYITAITCPNNLKSNENYCLPDENVILCSKFDPKPGLWNGGILKSIDGGITWATINNGLDKGFYNHGSTNKCFPLNYFDIKIDPSDHNRIYTGQFFQHNNNYRDSIIYRSDNGGDDGWHEVAWYRFDGAVEDTNIEFAWKKVSSDGGRVLSGGKILINPNNPNEVYFYGKPAQVFKTVNALEPNPGDINWNFLGVEKIGNYWKTTGLEGIATPNGIGIDPWDSNRVLYSFADHFTMLSIDGGYTLKPVIDDTDGGVIIYDKFDSNLLYVARSGPAEAAKQGKIHKSTNKGEEGSWDIIGGSNTEEYGLPHGGYTDIILDNPDSNTRTLYVPVYDSNSGSILGVYMKNGIDAELWNIIWEKNNVRSIEGFPENNFNYLFAGVESDGIYRLDISNFPTVIEEKKIDSSIIGNTIFQLKKDSLGSIYAATDNGIWKSTDMGESWNLLRSVKEAWDFAIHPQNDNLMYFTSTVEGIWKSEDGGNSWIDVTDGIETRVFMTLELDPNNQNKVITATRCSGEWIGDMGPCIPTLHPADTDCDDIIDITELIIYIDRWKNNDPAVTISTLFDALVIWKG